MIAALGTVPERELAPVEPQELIVLEADMADRPMRHPEEPAEMFRIKLPRRGLLRSGGLLARATNRVNRKRRAQ